MRPNLNGELRALASVAAGNVEMLLNALKRQLEHCDDEDEMDRFLHFTIKQIKLQNSAILSVLDDDDCSVDEVTDIVSR
jgi:hypothetical protein